MNETPTLRRRLGGAGMSRKKLYPCMLCEKLYAEIEDAEVCERSHKAAPFGYVSQASMRELGRRVFGIKYDEDAAIKKRETA